MAKNQDAAPSNETSTEHTTPAQKKREEKKSRWTPALCLKFAKRFESEVDWAAGAPSSYKAAVARGYLSDCTKHMSARPTASKKSSAAKTSTKKRKSA